MGRRRNDLDWRKAFAAFVALWAATLLGFHLFEAQVIDSEQQQIQGACHRLNIVRATANNNALVNYRGDQAFVALLRRNVKAGHRVLAPKQRAAQLAFADSVARNGDRLAWVPLTNCAEARYPSYRVPEPVRFVHGLPPSEAFKGARNR